MIVMGIDSSTWVGLARTDGTEHMGKTVDFPKLRGWQRVQLIAANVGATIDNWKPDFAVIENYALGMKKSGDTIVTIVSIGALIRVQLYERGIPWIEIRPSTLKKWTTGRGDAKKPDMAASVKEKWGFESHSDDVIDAFALAQMGYHIAQNPQNKLPTGVINGYGNLPS